jgi:Haem-binding domain
MLPPLTGKSLYRLLFRLCLVGAVLLLLIQLVPYGHRHSNPPVVREPQWDGPGTKELARRACFDCHSNETTWPWYASIAPLSWLVVHDVEDGRRKLNFSDWQGGHRKAEAAKRMRKEIQEGDMPPLPYWLAHPQARLSAEEKQRLIQGLEETTRNDHPEN